MLKKVVIKITVDYNFYKKAQFCSIKSYIWFKGVGCHFNNRNIFCKTGIKNYVIFIAIRTIKLHPVSIALNIHVTDVLGFFRFIIVIMQTDPNYKNCNFMHIFRTQHSSAPLKNHQKYVNNSQLFTYQQKPSNKTNAFTN